MLTNPSSSRSKAGRMMVVATVAVALPLTATRAIEYVDVPVAPAPTQPLAAPVPLAPQAPAAPVAPLAPVAAAAPVAPIAPLAPAAPVAPLKSLNFDGDGMININGRTKHWRDLTPEEKAEVRREIAHAKRELARTRIDRAEIQRDVQEALREAQVDKEELRRDLAEARAEIHQAMREIDSNAVHLRRAGQNPEAIKAQVRASLRSVEAIDVEAITRQALASVDHKAIEASVAAAEASVARAQADIEQLEEQFEDE